MSITIYHNPRCSKSRKTLELLEQAGVNPTIVEYLGSPPDAATILSNAKLMGVKVADLLRRGEDEFKQARDLPDLDDDAALARGRVTGANDPDRVRLHQCPHKQQLRVQRVLVLERHQGEEHSKRAEHACVSRL